MTDEDYSFHTAEAKRILDAIGRDQVRTGRVALPLPEALAAAQVHATLAVAEAIKEASRG